MTSARVLTFLFTDIEGSTQLVEAHGETYARALADHRRILRRTCAQHSGDEIGTTGDGYFAVFEHGADAVAAAIDAQLALRAHAWPAACELRVRMGLHTGEAEFDSGDLTGVAVHAAARVSAAAHGGQILASDATAAAAGGGFGFKPLGKFPMRGVSAPLELLQVLHPQLPQDFAAPSVGKDPHPIAGPRTIRVLIVDDQEMVRTGFRMILGASAGLSVVGEAGNGLEAIDEIARVEPDVVLMDIRMPEMNGIEATQRIAAMPDAPKVVILTTFDLDEYVYDALRAGASGFMLKDAPPADVVRAIEVVAAGESLLAPSITRKLIGEFTTRSPQTPAKSVDRLSDRETEVLAHIARGLTNSELAETLFISEATVKTHVRNLLTKLDARDRVQLVVYAYEAGLVTPTSGA
ncbi:MAG TPA: response regulator [Acidimicrobiales bacterium]|nr:response regulator [Acidimicrobiales bacterium]